MAGDRVSLRKTLSGFFRFENRRREIRRGTLERIRGFASTVFGNERDLTIYLPSGYGERAGLRAECTSVEALGRLLRHVHLPAGW